uniref:TM2 domain-containing protein n=1 Tax=Romanomermis culicivorax TaxID=13658 RepID=A0A915I3S4_ROMCU
MQKSCPTYFSTNHLIQLQPSFILIFLLFCEIGQRFFAPSYMLNAFYCCFTLISIYVSNAEAVQHCSSLLIGQYLCHSPLIDPATQQPYSCSPSNIAFVNCTVAPNVLCDPLDENGTFTKEIPCQFSSGKSWRVTVGLSVFFGWLGLDRFYLGYYGTGLIKFTTFGFFFIFHLIDVVLVALQIVGPADGTSYYMDYYGARMTHLYYNSSLVEPV